MTNSALSVRPPSGVDLPKWMQHGCGEELETMYMESADPVSGGTGPSTAPKELDISTVVSMQILCRRTNSCAYL